MFTAFLFLLAVVITVSIIALSIVLGEFLQMSCTLSVRGFHIWDAILGWNLLTSKKPTNAADADIMFDNLVAVSNCLWKNDVKFMLSEGTALGAIRENDIIVGDSDVDLCLIGTEDSVKYLHRAVQELTSTHGFRIIRIVGWRFPLKIPTMITLYRNGHYVDIDVCYPGRWSAQVPGISDDVLQYMLRPESTMIRGVEFDVPGPSTKYLSFLYGTDWRTPKAGFKPIFHRNNQKQSQKS